MAKRKTLTAPVALSAREAKAYRERIGATRLRQTPEGEIHAYGDFPRGDGGPRMKCDRCGKDTEFAADSIAEWHLCPACGNEADRLGIPYELRGRWARDEADQAHWAWVRDQEEKMCAAAIKRELALRAAKA